ncbi:MAG: AAA family ATPase [Anaerolineae bacterium]
MSSIADVQATASRIRAEVGRVIVGKDSAVDLLIVALLCEGHVLLEDVPGIGKTTLAKALAKSIGCVFQRIQFTPDLLPSDITGISVYNQKTGDFEYRPGPLMSQIVLADEINRAGPRTQSALLEVMQERQVTVDGVTRFVPRPFLVLATQNPIELEGTFPLPEAQLDRFLLRLELGYPDGEEERAIMRRFRREDPLESLSAVVDAAELLSLGQRCREVFVHPVIEDYIIEIVRRTRQNEGLALGASPRGSLALMRTGQALAALRGHDFIQPDDIQNLVAPVITHRLLPSVRTRLRGHAAKDIVAQIVEATPVPVEENWAEEVAG